MSRVVARLASLTGAVGVGVEALGDQARPSRSGNYLSEKPAAKATATDRFNRLKRIAQTWGDGWVLRQAIATVPADLDLQMVADHAGSEEPTLAAAASREHNARSHNKDAQRWQPSLASCESELDQRHWVFSLLSIARPRAVLDAAPRLNEVVSALSPKHYAAVPYALGWFMTSSAARELVFAEPLRRQVVHWCPWAGGPVTSSYRPSHPRLCMLNCAAD